MGQIKAITDCVISRLLFKDGDKVEEGQEVLYTEVMKMLVPATTNSTGIITYKVKQYDYVYAGTIMAEIKEHEQDNTSNNNGIADGASLCG